MMAAFKPTSFNLKIYGFSIDLSLVATLFLVSPAVSYSLDRLYGFDYTLKISNSVLLLLTILHYLLHLSTTLLLLLLYRFFNQHRPQLFIHTTLSSASVNNFLKQKTRCFFSPTGLNLRKYPLVNLVPS